MARRNREVPGGGTTGPLALFADDYEMKLRARGYSARSVTSELRQVARLRRRYCGGGWWPRGRELALFNAGLVTTTRYRYRGSVIPSPWPLGAA